MSVTVEDLLKAHEGCIKARAEFADVSELYPVEGVPYETTLFEFAYERQVKADKAMKALMAQATPEVIAEARKQVKRT